MDDETIQPLPSGAREASGGARLKWLKRPLEALLGFFYPAVCQLCGSFRAGAAQGYVCHECRRRVRAVERPFCERCGHPFAGAISTEFECAWCCEEPLQFDVARSIVIFDGPVREALHRYKYNRALWLEPFLAEWLRSDVARHFQPGDWDCLAPVPLHRVKQREREFNQAERLGRHVSLALDVPMDDRLLARVQNTRTQTQLNREERVANLRHAFALCRGRLLEGERVLLFDDVMTTGATMNACAKVLRRGGAGRVGVCTLARGVL
jgi:ComF family protein